MAPVSVPAHSSVDSEVVHLATSNVRFSRILVGTDFSKPASHALKVAIAISETFGSELILVSAASPPVYGPGIYPASTEFFYANLDGAKEEMDQLISSEPRLSKLKIKTNIAYGGAVDLIEQIATEEKVDLIVLGSNGASGLERLVLGSVAETVLRKAKCPVLIVGPKCHSEQNPFRSILFATDLKLTGLRPAQYAAALAEGADGRLTLLHVVEKDRPVPGPDTELIEDNIKLALQRLVPADADFFCTPKVRIEYGVPGEVIPGVATSELASMVVVGLRERSALADHVPSTTLSNIIRETPCSVLAVRSHLL